MAFFENLSKKASEASAKAIQMTKEFSDTTRLNSMISTEEKNITNTYCQIGKLYVSMYQGHYDEQFEAMVAAIYGSEEKIKAYKEQIQGIKGIQYCKNCGAEVPRGAAFCSSCGSSMPKVEQAPTTDDYVLCAKCGERVKKDMRFCTACGNPMSSDNNTTNIYQTTQESDTVSNEPSGKRICPVCGAEVKPDLVFCDQCGTKM